MIFLGEQYVMGMQSLLYMQAAFKFHLFLIRQLKSWIVPLISECTYFCWFYQYVYFLYQHMLSSVDRSGPSGYYTQMLGHVHIAKFGTWIKPKIAVLHSWIN